MDGECWFVLLQGKWRRCRCGSFWSLHGILSLGGAFILCVIEKEQEDQEEEELHDWVSRNFCCREGARGEWVVKSLQICWEKKKQKKALKSVEQIWFWKSLWKQKKKKNKNKNSNNRNHERKQRLERRGFVDLRFLCEPLLSSVDARYFYPVWGTWWWCLLSSSSSSSSSLFGDAVIWSCLLWFWVFVSCFLWGFRSLGFFFSSRNSDLLPLGRWSCVMCVLGCCCCNLIVGWALVDHYLLRRKLGLESFTVF